MGNAGTRKAQNIAALKEIEAGSATNGGAGDGRQTAQELCLEGEIRWHVSASRIWVWSLKDEYAHLKAGVGPQPGRGDAEGGGELR
jgi:hypothetical protein